MPFQQYVVKIRKIWNAVSVYEINCNQVSQEKNTQTFNSFCYEGLDKC